MNVNTYSMSQVETLTGIKSHTLRIWERRYNFLKPQRTDTNIRFYSDYEIRKLLNIAILMNKGYRISKIDKMSDEELGELIIELHANPSGEFADDINLLTLSMLEMKEGDFDSVFRRHVMRNGITSTVVNLIYPFLDHIGILWSTYSAIPAQEHFISNLIRQKIVAAIDSIPQPSSGAKKIIMFLPELENHEIGLLLASYIAKDLGWIVYYLGQNVPLVNIVEVQEIVNSNLMFTIIVTPVKQSYAVLFKDVLEKTNLPLLVAGKLEEEANLRSYDKIKFTNSPQKFIDYLKNMA
jgi:DNA-binding transcriptional MerR regulator